MQRFWNLFKIKLIHRQIFKDLFMLFSLSLGTLLALILVGRMLQLREMFLALDLSVWDLFKLFFFLTPFFLLLLTPISGMLSVFLTFLRMGTDRELTALKASGFSLVQLLPAPLVFCLLLTGFNYIIAFDGLSWGMTQFRSTVTQLIKSRTQLVLQPGVFNREIPGVTFYSGRVGTRDGEMENVFVRDRTRRDNDVTIIARNGVFHTEPDQGFILLELSDGRIYRASGGAFNVLKFDQYSIKLPLAELLRDLKNFYDVRPKEMSFSKLKELERTPGYGEIENGRMMRKVLVEQQKRLAQPFACLVLGLFALPIACAFQGLRQSFGLAVSLGLFLLYYTMFSLGVSLGESGAVNPVAGLWVPNILFFIFAVIGIRVTSRERNARLIERVRHMRILPRFGRRAS